MNGTTMWFWWSLTLLTMPLLLLGLLARDPIMNCWRKEAGTRSPTQPREWQGR